MGSEDYKVTLYTYHGCPYAHRVHIALAELGVKYEQVHIDLDKPREPWYLQINPVSIDRNVHTHHIRSTNLPPSAASYQPSKLQLQHSAANTSLSNLK